jgi:hypothetical protein
MIRQNKNLDVQILVPVWGKEYISDFLNFSLRALFLKNNIPNVLKKHNVKITYLTTKESTIEIQRNPIFKTYQKIIRSEFIYIDDLIVNFNYSTILTLAYARGFENESDETYFNTLFILLNSDFILSNGSLSSIVLKANEGASAVFGASLRVESQELRKYLKKKFTNKNLGKVFSSRELLKFAFNNLHPTVKAMMLNSNMLKYKVITKFYWAVSSTTLVSHDYLLCCMGIVPQRRMKFVKSFVDYSFVPELTNLRTHSHLTDSDNYLALEMQNFDKEIEFISIEGKTTKSIAKHMSTWTTEYHRSTAEQLIVFHSEELENNFTEKIIKFEELFLTIKNQMKRKPKNYIDHPHWVGGVTAWLYHLTAARKEKIDLSEISPLIYPLFSKKPLHRFLFKLINQTKIYFKKTLTDYESSIDFEVIEQFVNQKNTLLITDQNDAYEAFSKRMNTIMNFKKSGLKLYRNETLRAKVTEVIIFSTISNLQECLQYKRIVANYFGNDLQILIILRLPTGPMKKIIADFGDLRNLQFEEVSYYTKVGLPRIQKVKTYFSSKLTNFKISRFLIYGLLIPTSAITYVVSNIIESQPIRIKNGLEKEYMGIILR